MRAPAFITMSTPRRSASRTSVRAVYPDASYANSLRSSASKAARSNETPPAMDGLVMCGSSPVSRRLRLRLLRAQSFRQRGESTGQGGARILTVGHSTRMLAQFVALLAENGVALLADVRKLRGSRAFPHF